MLSPKNSKPTLGSMLSPKSSKPTISTLLTSSTKSRPTLGDEDDFSLFRGAAEMLNAMGEAFQQATTTTTAGTATTSSNDQVSNIEAAYAIWASCSFSEDDFDPDVALNALKGNDQDDLWASCGFDVNSESFNFGDFKSATRHLAKDPSWRQLNCNKVQDIIATLREEKKNKQADEAENFNPFKVLDQEKLNELVTLVDPATDAENGEGQGDAQDKQTADDQGTAAATKSQEGRMGRSRINTSMDRSSRRSRSASRSKAASRSPGEATKNRPAAGLSASVGPIPRRTLSRGLSPQSVSMSPNPAGPGLRRVKTMLDTSSQSIGLDDSAVSQFSATSNASNWTVPVLPKLETKSLLRAATTEGAGPNAAGAGQSTLNPTLTASLHRSPRRTRSRGVSTNNAGAGLRRVKTVDATASQSIALGELRGLDDSVVSHFSASRKNSNWKPTMTMSPKPEAQGIRRVRTLEAPTIPISPKAEAQGLRRVRTLEAPTMPISRKPEPQGLRRVRTLEATTGGTSNSKELNGKPEGQQLRRVRTLGDRAHSSAPKEAESSVIDESGVFQFSATSCSTTCEGTNCNEQKTKVCSTKPRKTSGRLAPFRRVKTTGETPACFKIDNGKKPDVSSSNSLETEESIHLSSLVADEKEEDHNEGEDSFGHCHRSAPCPQSKSMTCSEPSDRPPDNSSSSSIATDTSSNKGSRKKERGNKSKARRAKSSVEHSTPNVASSQAPPRRTKSTVVESLSKGEKAKDQPSSQTPSGRTVGERLSKSEKAKDQSKKTKKDKNKNRGRSPTKSSGEPSSSPEVSLQKRSSNGATAGKRNKSADDAEAAPKKRISNSKQGQRGDLRKCCSEDTACIADDAGVSESGPEKRESTSLMKMKELCNRRQELQKKADNLRSSTNKSADELGQQSLHIMDVAAQSKRLSAGSSNHSNSRQSMGSIGSLEDLEEFASMDPSARRWITVRLGASRQSLNGSDHQKERKSCSLSPPTSKTVIADPGDSLALSLSPGQCRAGAAMNDDSEVSGSGLQRLKNVKLSALLPSTSSKATDTVESMAEAYAEREIEKMREAANLLAMDASDIAQPRLSSCKPKTLAPKAG